jgi:Ca-activated chloride channel family protein
VVDAQGSPLNVDLPPDKDLRQALNVYLDGQEMNPFFATSESGGAQTVRGRIALVLVDVSGSMNRRLSSGKTRFETAQEALGKFLEGFQENVDRIAIVPFESHAVVSRIQSAQFATTRSQVLSQISALPAPGPKNNTALYSAVASGLQVLKEQAAAVTNASASGSPEMLLVVMTDGKNEILSGDDPGLLDGPMGLKQAADAVQTSGIQVIGVGFGDPGSIDEASLRQISTKTYTARDLDELKQIFSIARTLLTNRLVVTFESPWNDRASLEGRTLRVTATLKLPTGQQFESGEGIWSAPQMSVPAFDGKCDMAELHAALPLIPGSSNWLSTVRPALVFVGLGTLLLVLWFWVPRLLWPEQYIGRLPAVGGKQRWAEASRVSAVSAVKPVRRAPPGFETRDGEGQPPREVSDRTVVQPKPDFSRSRLQRRPQDGGNY